MSLSKDFEIVVDFTAVERAAGRVRDMLIGLRLRFDLARFEYAKQVRIAPTELPRSHPVITLNTWVRDDIALLSMYLHEQMHWYSSWFSKSFPSCWEQLLELLCSRYSEVPIAGDGGAQDDFSTYLHILVNWCEIEAASQFVHREVVVRHVESLPFYRWIYRTVLNDWKELDSLYREIGVVPIRYATDMSADDLKLAGALESRGERHREPRPPHGTRG
jgi:hypothetical protein